MTAGAVFGASILFLVYVGYRRRIRPLSLYGIFVMFHVLYNAVPLVLLNNYDGFSLYSDPDVVFTQLWMSSLSSLCFGVVYLRYFKDTPIARPPSLPGAMRRRYFLLSVPVFVLACLLASIYGWRELTHGVDTDLASAAGFMFTLTAYVKYWCVGIYLYYIYRFGLDKWAWAILGMHVVLMLIDNARLTFLPIVLFTLIIMSSNSKAKRLVYILAAVGIALSIFVRAALSPNPGDRVAQAMAPIIVEGGLGDYATLQSIYIMKHAAPASFQYGATYILDPLVWLVPQGNLRDSVSSLHGYVEANSGSLAENYAPWGGYYYLAEAVLNFGYLGPVVVTTLFALCLVYVDRNKNRLRMLYVSSAPTLGILFVKSVFGNVVKLFLIQLFVLMVYRVFSALNRLMKVSRYPSASAIYSGRAVIQTEH
jgi:hypothetical protein